MDDVYEGSNRSDSNSRSDSNGDSNSDSNKDINSISHELQHYWEFESECAFDYVECDVMKYKIGSKWKYLDRTELALAELGEFVNSRDKYGFTALHYACMYGSSEVVSLLLSQPAITVDPPSGILRTPLFFALEDPPSIEIVRLLLKAGAEVNFHDIRGGSPLLDVCTNDYNYTLKIELGTLLLEHGADPNFSNDTCFWSEMFDEEDEEEEEEERMQLQGTSPFLEALKLYYEDDDFDAFLNFVCMFLYYGAHVTERPRGWDSVFMQALDNGGIEVADLLFNYEDDFNQRMYENDYTIFMTAINLCYEKVFDMIDLGADINYCVGKQSCLSLSLNFTDPKLFLYIWNNCDKAYVLGHHDGFLLTFLKKVEFSREDFIDALYVILEYEGAYDLIDDLITEFAYIILINKLTSYKVAKTDRLGIIYTLLTINNRIWFEDLCEFYDTYGFNEEFEAFLIVNMEIIDFDPREHILTKICYPHETKRGFIEAPPTLLQRSRDVIRHNLQPQYKMGTDHVYFQYYNSVQQLDVPKCIKDIITLKTKLLSENKVVSYEYIFELYA